MYFIGIFKFIKVQYKKIEDARHLLNGCIKLKDIDFSNFDTSNIQYVEGIFDHLPEGGIFKYNSEIFNLTNLLPKNWSLIDTNTN